MFLGLPRVRCRYFMAWLVICRVKWGCLNVLGLKRCMWYGRGDGLRLGKGGQGFLWLGVCWRCLWVLVRVAAENGGYVKGLR